MSRLRLLSAAALLWPWLPTPSATSFVVTTDAVVGAL